MNDEMVGIYTSWLITFRLLVKTFQASLCAITIDCLLNELQRDTFKHSVMFGLSLKLNCAAACKKKR